MKPRLLLPKDWFFVLIILGLLILTGGALQPAFISHENLNSILFSSSVLMPAIVGMTFLLVLGKFDLSIGATASLVGMVTATCLASGLSAVISILFGLIVGSIVGFVSGVLVGYLRFDPLIVTLGMMGVARSAALSINDGRIVAGVSSSFAWPVNYKIGSVPVITLLTISTIILISLGVRHLVIMRRLYAVGSNEDAALYSGLNAGRMVLFGYIISSFTASVTGIFEVTRTLSASPLGFDTLPIEAIAACIIGGCSLAGGRGGVLGSSLGCLVIVAVDNLMIILGVSVDWQQGANGIIIIVFVIWPIVASKVLRAHLVKPRLGDRL